jgi:enolase-phosphatase E1
MINFNGRGILLDIEGTTSSISYVYDVMFPYARAHLEAFLERQWDDAAVATACEMIAGDAGHASLDAWCGGDARDRRRTVTNEVIRLMDADVKATGLKQLQGLIWRDGFESGEMTAHVYDDVPPALERWRDAGLTLAIFSSGSVTAQRLFMGHSVHGDLLPRFDGGHFDTTTGPKKETASYRAIADALGLPAPEILFVSDVVAELDAAAAAGMRTALSVRPGNPSVEPGHGHPAVSSFDEIDIDPSTSGSATP